MSSLDEKAIADYLQQLAALPWFSQLGKPLSDAAACRQIFSWDEWPGPEEQSVAEIAQSHQALYDELMASESAVELQAIWKRIEAVVLPLAKSSVPYDDELDTWHGPNLAVWQAVWTCGLIGFCRYQKRPIPLDLQTQFDWFAKGRWPCDWDGDRPAGVAVIF